MTLTLSDITPIGLCIATQDLFDAKKFQLNFCDNLLLRARDKNLEPKITILKRELNSTVGEKKFIEGHKTAIINNVDKILSLVSSRYSQINYKIVQDIVYDGKIIINKVLEADNFNKITELESIFKSKITFPTYELFIQYLKKSKTQEV